MTDMGQSGCSWLSESNMKEQALLERKFLLIKTRNEEVAGFLPKATASISGGKARV